MLAASRRRSELMIEGPSETVRRYFASVGQRRLLRSRRTSRRGLLYNPARQASSLRAACVANRWGCWHDRKARAD